MQKSCSEFGNLLNEKQISSRDKVINSSEKKGYMVRFYFSPIEVREKNNSASKRKY